MKFLILGANGQLGMEVSNLLDEKKIEYTALSSKELDITDKVKVDKFFDDNQPQYVFDCAAYTNVDGAEYEPGRKTNYEVNYVGTKNIADAVKSYNGTLVYVSTDYVFDGNSTEEYFPDSKTNPMNEYGKIKLMAEKYIESKCAKYYIIRTSWLYGKYGKNFVYTMLNLSKTMNEISVVDDQVGRPTWTYTLASFMLYAVEHDIEYGIYQLSNDNSASWFDFASEILKNENVLVKNVDSSKFPQKAYRPKNSIMNLDKVKNTGFVIPTWKNALQNFLSKINN